MISFRLDEAVRRSVDGRTLFGGSPFRILTLSEANSVELDRVIEGDRVPGDQQLTDRLYGLGFLQPVTPELGRDLGLLQRVDVVVPTKDRPESIAAILAQLPVDLVASVTIVDDGSDPALDLGSTRQSGVRIVCSERPLGAGGARHLGTLHGTARYVLFIDDDMVIDRAAGGVVETIYRLLGLAEAWGVGAIAPRIVGEDGPSLLERFEAEGGGIDRGGAGGLVAPGTRIPFVSSGMLLVRRDAYEAVGGFRPGMLRGEDVDLVWRLHRAGWSVRYEPAVVVAHRSVCRWRDWLGQRHGYGRSTAELGALHPGEVSALSISPWSVAVWALLAAGGPLRTLVGLATWGASIGLLVPALRGRTDDPVREALNLAGTGTLYAGDALASTARRSWWPLALLAAIVAPPIRRVVAGALVPVVLRWRGTKTALDPVRWCTIALADELAYGSGVWRGVVSAGSCRALRVRWLSLDDLVVPESSGV